MTTNEMIEVMNAYELGEKIQYKSVELGGDWIDATLEPSWNWVDCEYRVKPKNKYRPYKELNEFLSHWQDLCSVKPVVSALGGCWLFDKTENINRLVTATDATADKIALSDLWCSWEYALNRLTYLDGTPFGIKED